MVLFDSGVAIDDKEALLSLFQLPRHTIPLPIPFRKGSYELNALVRVHQRGHKDFNRVANRRLCRSRDPDQP